MHFLLYIYRIWFLFLLAFLFAVIDCNIYCFDRGDIADEKDTLKMIWNRQKTKPNNPKRSREVITRFAETLTRKTWIEHTIAQTRRAAQFPESMHVTDPIQQLTGSAEHVVEMEKYYHEPDRIALPPAAVPTVSLEEAKRINQIALDYTQRIKEERLEKKEVRRMHLLSKAQLIYSEVFSDFSPIGKYMRENDDKTVVNKGYNLPEFRQRLLPSTWRDMDFNTLPQEAFFGKDNKGFQVKSLKANLRFHAYRSMIRCMNYSFFFEAVVKNNSSVSDCKIDSGILGDGVRKKGYVTVQKHRIPVNETRTISWDINPYEGFYQLKPTLSVCGDVTIKEFRIYRLFHPEISVVEGTIKDRSELPAPETTDYPDCSYTAHFIGNAIFEGLPCNKELELTIDGFINKTYLASNGLKKGDIIRCSIVRFDQVPETKSSGTQVADDLLLFDLDSYMLLSYQRINSFSNPLEINTNTIEFADSEQTEHKYISIYDNIFNPAMDEEAKLIQKNNIKKDLKRITNMLAPYTNERKRELNKSFQEVWTKEKVKDPQGYNRINNIVWRNVDNAFYALPEQYSFIKGTTQPILQQNIDALVAFKEYLELQGIQLIVSLVPNYYAISARVINKEFISVPDFETAYVTKQLLENGIETIYASDEIIRNYNKYPIPYLYPNNSHPGDLPQDVLSSMIAERISRFHLQKKYDEKDFSTVFGDYGIGYWGSMSYPQNCDIGNNQAYSHYNYISVLYQGKPVNSNHDSPIILLGNSFSYSPTKQSLMSFLAMKTGQDIFQFSVGTLGPFTTAIQRIFNTPEYYLKDKKVLVFQMGTEHFLLNPSILNIKKLDLSMKISRSGKLIRTISLPANESDIPDFARDLSNPIMYRIGVEGEATIVKVDNISACINDDSQSSKGHYYIEITYCCQELDHLSLSINANTYRLIGGNYTYLYLKEVFPVSLDSHDLTINVLGEPGKFLAIGSIRIYQMDE